MSEEQIEKLRLAQGRIVVGFMLIQLALTTALIFDRLSVWGFLAASFVWLALAFVEAYSIKLILDEAKEAGDE